MSFLVIHILTYHIIFSKVDEAKENQGKSQGVCFQILSSPGVPGRTAPNTVPHANLRAHRSAFKVLWTGLVCL